MSDVLVLGGGICGLATAMLLARDGHGVRVLERDPEEVPDTLEDAWLTWDRRGVAQFRQGHGLLPLYGVCLKLSCLIFAMAWFGTAHTG